MSSSVWKGSVRVWLASACEMSQSACGSVSSGIPSLMIYNF